MASMPATSWYYWLIACGIIAAVSSQSCRYPHETKTYRQPVDHFAYANQDKYDQRYLINTDDWTPGGPIFFYTGNEGAIELFCDNTGFVWEIAPSYGAMVVFAEHRYYGSSMPYGAASFSNPAHTGYLTSEQALADYAQLIVYIHATYGPGPVVVFGGSYGGMLAAWFRIKYPWFCVGAIAASAPIWQFTGLTDCTAAFDIISADIEQISPQCAANVHSSWDAINVVGNDSAGLQWLTTAFQLCKPLTTVADLTTWLQGMWFNLAEVNYPYPANFIAPLPAWPLNATCQRLSTPYSSSKLLLTALAAAVQVYSNTTGNTSCLNVTQDGPEDLGLNGWDYQSCTEMVMPMCSNGVTDVFYDNPWNLTSVIESCQKKFSVTPRPYWVRAQYGGKNITAASNIVFSNGMLDPWSGGGVRDSLSDTLVAVLIPEGAHHLDLRASNPADPDSVVLARVTERAHISHWLKEYYNH